MSYSLDYFKRLERPFIYLADPNKNHLGTIQARELQSDMCFNNISTATFKVYKYEDGIETSNYESIEMLRLVEITYLGWFQITKADKYGYGTNYEYKEVNVSSLENEATSKTLTSFGQLGTDDDEQGGLDRYRLYSIADPEHSILHIWQKKLPSWSIGHVDPMITQEYRTFTNDEVGAYSFLVEDVSKTFECIFQFDTYNQTVNAYKLENIGQVTSIYLSYRNLVKSISQSANFSDIKTVYTVAGGDDNGSTLGIIEVNPSGNNQITNFSYYKPWMSTALQNRLDAYQIEYNNRQTVFNNAITTLQSYYAELNDLYNKLPSTPGSTNWSEYGLKELNVKHNTYNNTMADYVAINDTSNPNYSVAYNYYIAVDNEIIVRKNQISSKETQIDNQSALCQSLVLNIHDFLGDELYKELSRYYHEDTFTDDTFVATDAMTTSEVLQMKKDLLALAQSDLAKRCKPQYQIEVDAVNFAAIPEFKEYTDQLELGNIITLDFGNGVLVESRLLKIHMNWDNPEDFSLTFGSKNRLDGVFEQLAEIQSQANGVSTAYNISGTGWNTAKNKTSTFSQYMSSTLNLANQKLKNSSNETFVADSTGVKLRKLIDGTDNYSPNQMWGTSNGWYLTRDSWQSVEMAIGEGTYNGQTMYGVWAPLICGDLLLGQNLSIINESGTFNINNNGFTATSILNGNTYTVGINPNTPSSIFRIAVNGSNKLYVDTVNNRLNIEGYINATGGTLGDLTVNGTLTGGTISGSYINGGTITGGTVTGTNITGSTISGSTLTSTGYRDSIYQKTLIQNGYITTNYIKVKPMNSNDFSDDSAGYTFIGAKQIGIYNNGANELLITNGNIVCTGVKCENGDGTFKTMTLSGALTANGGMSASSGTFGTISGQTVYSGGQIVLTTYNIHTNIIPADDSTDGYIQFNGARAAGYNWVDNNFQRKSSSDFRLKKNIKSLEELPYGLFMELKPKMYEFKCKGYGEGTHFGFLAQEIESAFEKYGYSALDYNIIEIRDKRDNLDEGQYLLDGKIHVVNYENMHAWNTLMIQKIIAKIGI
jgi:hypothetical protein